MYVCMCIIIYMYDFQQHVRRSANIHNTHTHTHTHTYIRFQVAETIENIRRPGRVTALKRVVRNSYKKFYVRTAANALGIRSNEGKPNGGNRGSSGEKSASAAIDGDLKRDIEVLAKAVEHAKEEAQQGYAAKYVSQVF
jgi:hypothetical protein